MCLIVTKSCCENFPALLTKKNGRVFIAFRFVIFSVVIKTKTAGWMDDICGGECIVCF